MGKSSDIQKLFKAINSKNFNKQNDIKINEIRELAKKILRDKKTLNIYHEYSFHQHSFLEAAIENGSLAIFQLLIELGADPFLKPNSDLPSAIEILTTDYFLPYKMPFSSEKKEILLKWLMEGRDSPIYTWSKLAENSKLFREFQKSGLIPEKIFINELPLHVAIEAGRIDLIQEILKAAGSVQKAGDISRMSILYPAILAALKSQANAMDVLRYLLQQGASTHTSDLINLPAIFQTIHAGLFNLHNVKEDKVIEIIQLLIEYGATLDSTNPNNGYTTIMSAVTMGYSNLFHFLLTKANAATLNHRASISPNYLIFQLFDRFSNKLFQLDTVKLLSELKAKGLEFNKTIDMSSPSDPFHDEGFYRSDAQVSVRGMSLLHYYVDSLANRMDGPFILMDKHLAIIQSLIANGADPQVKATFTSIKEVKEGSFYQTKKISTNIELTAAEYLRKIANKILTHSYSLDASRIKQYPNEQEFLNSISYENNEEQKNLHFRFHQFRNLERVLKGDKPLPYTGFPNLKKMEKFVLTSSNLQANPSSISDKEDFNPQTLEEKLIQARTEKNNFKWKALKKSMVDYIQRANSLDDFQARIEQFKKPLQLHFNLTTNEKGEIMSYGSIAYRFFHFFDRHKFPNSWESLRQFGNNAFGVDINTQYAQYNTLAYDI